MRRVSATVAAMVVLATLAFTSPAMAQPSPDLLTVRIGDPRGGELTGASVSAVMAQQEYADISFNVEFEGFTAQGPFPFAEGRCPSRLVRVDAPAEVFKCGWIQEASGAKLSLALRGTFDRSTISVTLAPNAMVAPREPGRYRVSVTGWSFDEVTRRVLVVPGPCSSGPAVRGDVACPR